MLLSVGFVIGLVATFIVLFVLMETISNEALGKSFQIRLILKVSRRSCLATWKKNELSQKLIFQNVIKHYIRTTLQKQLMQETTFIIEV